MNEEFSGAYESIMESLDTGTMYGEGILEQLEEFMKSPNPQIYILNGILTEFLDVVEALQQVHGDLSEIGGGEEASEQLGMLITKLSTTAGN